jgi:hypothetical protein
MLRRSFRRLRRAIARAGTDLLVRAMASEDGNRLLRGNGWVGCWSGSPGETVDIATLNSHVDRTYDDVAARGRCVSAKSGRGNPKVASP